MPPVHDPTSLPRSFDAERKRTYLEALRNGCLKGEAARAARVSPSTVSAHRRADPEFADEEQAALRHATEAIERVLFNAALREEPWAVKMWLQAHAGDTYREKREVTVQGEIHHTAGPEGVEQLIALRNDVQSRLALLAGEPGEPDEEIHEAELL